MKKFFAVFLSVAALVGCLFAFSACGNNESTLVMEKRYFRETEIRSEGTTDYYLFHSDGTGEYEYHYDYNSIYNDPDWDEHRHYIIHFKYTYVDNDHSSVVCFYDSLERLEGDDGKYSATDWSNLITVSKNVLMTVGTSYTFWINEDYLEEIPNFKK